MIAAPTKDQFDLLTPSSGTVTLVYEVFATDAPDVVNSVTIFIALSGTATTGTGVISGSLGYAPVGPPASNAALPQFVAATSNTVATVTVCATYLLFPWVATDNKGGIDTGFAISNTSADPAVIGTVNQAGSVTVYFFPAAGGTAPSPVNLAPSGGKAGDPLPAGQTATFVLGSTLNSAFSGYVIAVCGFQYGHGFAFISNPAFASTGWTQGYLALSLTNPRPGVTESVAH